MEAALLAHQPIPPQRTPPAAPRVHRSTLHRPNRAQITLLDKEAALKAQQCTLPRRTEAAALRAHRLIPLHPTAAVLLKAHPHTLPRRTKAAAPRAHRPILLRLTAAAPLKARLRTLPQHTLAVLLRARPLRIQVAFSQPATQAVPRAHLAILPQCTLAVSLRARLHTLRLLTQAAPRAHPQPILAALSPPVTQAAPRARQLTHPRRTPAPAPAAA